MAMRAYITTEQGKSRPRPEYAIYHAAKQRCTNSSDRRYSRYGGRGIEFRFPSFETFLDALKTPDNPNGLRPEGVDAKGKALYSLDRINNDGHYEKGNVRWATKRQQLSTREPSFGALRKSAPIVVIYTRHKPSCPLRGQEDIPDGCQKWLRWSVTTETGNVQHRIPTKTSSLALAEVKRQQVQNSVENQWSNKKHPASVGPAIIKENWG